MPALGRRTADAPALLRHLGAAGTRLAVAVWLVLAAAAGVAAQGADASLEGKAVVLDVRGAIGPATSDYLHNALGTAASQGAALIVLRMDTPGGLSSSMRDIIRDMLASPVPVATYVAPSGARAASAGTYILYASQLAAMAPGTNLGAATPVRLGGGGAAPGAAEGDGDSEGREAPADASEAKAVNDAVAYIRSLAELHGRDADWAERAVRSAESLSARAALEQGVIEIVATDLRHLLDQADGRSVRLGGEETTLRTAGIEIATIEPGWRSSILSAITDPNLAYILLLIGIYGIVFEFFNPGIVFSGVIGGISLIVALFALNMLPVNFAGASLLLFGVALMAAEAFVPSFGVLGIGGAAAFALGSLFMFEEVPGFGLSWTVVATATLVTAALFILVLAAGIRALRRRVTAGGEALPGDRGEVLEWSGTNGAVHVQGERWQARADAPLAPGDRIRVRARDRLVLVVEPDLRPEEP